MAAFFDRWRRKKDAACCSACFGDLATGPLNPLKVCGRCDEALRDLVPKNRVAKWGLTGLRRAMYYLRTTSDVGAPFLLTASTSEIRMYHFVDHASEDALAESEKMVSEKRDALALYVVVFWGFVDETTKAYGFDSDPSHSMEALLFWAGGFGVEHAMLMGLLTERDQPTYFLGDENWL